MVKLLKLINISREKIKEITSVKGVSGNGILIIIEFGKLLFLIYSRIINGLLIQTNTTKG